MNKKIIKLVIFCLSLLILMLLPFFTSSVSEIILDATLKKEGHLPFVKTQEKFEELRQSSSANYLNDPIELDFDLDFGFNSTRNMGDVLTNGIDNLSPNMSLGSANTTSPSVSIPSLDNLFTIKETSSQAPAYSTTNVQVKGIDEADIVKNDGKYIYSISNNKLIITNAYPANELKVLSATALNANSTPYEMFISDSKLFMISNISYPNASYWRRYSSPTAITIFDISDRANPVKVKYFETSSNYVSSRKSGDKVYVIVSQAVSSSNDLPSYTQDDNTKITYLTFGEIMYVPNSTYSDFVTILSFDLKSSNAKPAISPYLSGGNTVYMSEDNLYLAVSSNRNNTCIYKFDMTSGDPVYQSKGNVPGYIINQFAMDEYDDNFRIATTTQDGAAYNNVYVLNDRMSQIGSVTKLAKGETIKSVRFIGNKGYVVTYRNTDPLFVLDLSNPRFPKLLGELKIPGYSTYIHPYDETHIIGFGYDGNLNGGLNGRLKIAIFDVSDIKNPREMFVEKIDADSSDLLTNHKALLFDKGLELIAFPVNVQTYSDYNNFRYSTQKSIGKIYTINLTDGFTARGEVTHKDNGYIDRLLYIGNNIYSISNSEIKVNDISSIKEINDISF